ncbi:hypothetical protein D0499_05415 [Weissella soli]|uniref:hypothetical protein n=1 Tax=Weissella soli TaxID=155866 RepID=UPI0021C18D59|nr:hypothetical protein [Weissella soli]MCT8395248.1 hypothetical protein [Weissella soli]
MTISLLVGLVLVIAIEVYTSIANYKARLDYEQKAQRAVEAIEGWRDAYLKFYNMHRDEEEGGGQVEQNEQEQSDQADGHVL